VRRDEDDRSGRPAALKDARPRPGVARDVVENPADVLAGQPRIEHGQGIVGAHDRLAGDRPDEQRPLAVGGVN